MKDKPKRRLLQFHLSTVVIQTFMAGGLIFMNTHETTNGYLRHSSVHVVGWPFSITDKYYLDAQKERAEGVDLRFDIADKTERGADGTVTKIEQAPIFHLSGLLLDIGVSVAILFTVGFLCEYNIRRREARKL